MTIEIIAQTRVEQGTGASRRLRREGKLPGVVYGAGKDAVAINLDHNSIFYALKDEGFHGAVLNLVLDGQAEQVLLRDAQMHPWKTQQVLHIDFQRVDANTKIDAKVALHFVNAENSPAVKLAAATISHVLNEVAVRALPGNLPACIEIDLSDMKPGQSIHLSELKLPEGVELVEVIRGHDGAVVQASGKASDIE